MFALTKTSRWSWRLGYNRRRRRPLVAPGAFLYAFLEGILSRQRRASGVGGAEPAAGRDRPERARAAGFRSSMPGRFTVALLVLLFLLGATAYPATPDALEVPIDFSLSSFLKLYIGRQKNYLLEQRKRGNHLTKREKCLTR